MFNLEAAINDWRQKMLDTGIKTPVPLDELENHLRDEIERLMQAGMDAKNSYEAAMEKIGAANALQTEFAKVEKETRAAKEARFVLAFSLVTIAVGAVTLGAMLYFKIGSFSELTAAQQNSGYAALSLMLLFCFVGRFVYKMFPTIGSKKIRDTICVSAGVALFVWWTVLFWGILPRHEYTMAELLVVIVWGFIMPFGLMTGLIAGIETSARKSVSANWQHTVEGSIH